MPGETGLSRVLETFPAFRMPRSPSTKRLRALLAQLAVRPSPEKIAAAASLLAEHVAARAKPDMAIGALFRHNAPTFPADLKQTVREEALALLRARATRVEPDHVASDVDHDDGWFLVHEAAPRLRLQERTLRDRLKQWRYRQMYGWPRWDGYQWLVPALAVKSSHTAAFLASLPEREPLPHLLPDWCERQP